MRQIEVFRALRAYDEAKDRLAKADLEMKALRSILGKSMYAYAYPPFITLSTQHIIDTISEFKKAHYAYEALFIDQDYERKIEDQKHLARAINESFRLTLERLMTADQETVIVGSCPHKFKSPDVLACAECRKELRLAPLVPVEDSHATGYWDRVGG